MACKTDLVAISLLLEHKINDAINLKILKWWQVIS